MSVTVRLDPAVTTAIATISEDAWTTIKYPNVIFAQATSNWVSKAEVAEVPCTAFTSRLKAERVPGRLVVSRIPDVHAHRKQSAGQGAQSDLWRFDAFFTTVPQDVLDTVAPDSTHRGHAIIEQVHADLKASALAHLPSGRFTANSAWLVLAVLARATSPGPLQPSPQHPTSPGRPPPPCAAS